MSQAPAVNSLLRWSSWKFQTLSQPTQAAALPVAVRAHTSPPEPAATSASCRLILADTAANTWHHCSELPTPTMSLQAGSTAGHTISWPHSRAPQWQTVCCQVCVAMHTLFPAAHASREPECAECHALCLTTACLQCTGAWVEQRCHHQQRVGPSGEQPAGHPTGSGAELLWLAVVLERNCVRTCRTMLPVPVC